MWKLPDATAHLLDDNHLDDADALLTLARCLSRAEQRASSALRQAIAAELSLYASAWIEQGPPSGEVAISANDG